MRAIVRYACHIGLLAVLLSQAHAAEAAAPSLVGEIDGIELLPQTRWNGAIFLFEFRPDDGSRSGWGWIEVYHDPLPPPDDFSDIVGGNGEIWVGWRRYEIGIVGGELVGWDAAGLDDDVYGVGILADVCQRRRGCTPHEFLGWLSHQTFIPRIFGSIQPVP